MQQFSLFETMSEDKIEERVRVKRWDRIFSVLLIIKRCAETGKA